MTISIIGRHVELKDSVKEYARSKFENLNRFFGGLGNVEVVFKSEDRKIHCEVIMHINKHGTVVVDVARDEFNEATDVALDKCERQLSRLKEKIEDKRPGKQPAVPEEDTAEADE